MLDKAEAGRLLEYTVWANHRVMRAAATVSVDDFKRDLGASYGGVRGTLCHIMGAEWIWLERWKGVSPGALIDEGEFEDIVALRDRWTVIEGHRDSWFKSLRPQAMAESLHYRTTTGAEFDAPLAHLVQHVANHSTYHRGQVVLMLRLLGAKTVSSDLVLWDRDREARAKHYG
jgi:uncharacterized damage-inducible protein DinB